MQAGFCGHLRYLSLEPRFGGRSVALERYMGEAHLAPTGMIANARAR